MKKRIVSGIMAAAMAIVPFTGTGIKAVDNFLKDTTPTLTAEAVKSGNYLVRKNFYLDGHLVQKGWVIYVNSSGYYYAWGRSFYVGGFMSSYLTYYPYYGQ